EKAKILALFNKLSEIGFIPNREKFRKLGQKSAGKGSELWEFKSFQDRFLGDYRPGGRFLVAAYTKKKKDRLDRDVVERALRILAENDKHESTGKGSTNGKASH